MRIEIEEIGGRGGNRPYYPQELMAVVMARALKDGEMVGTGAGSAATRAACRLAQLTHAPNLNFISGGIGAINPYLEPLVPSSSDYANLLCQSVIAISDFVNGFAAGRLDAFFYSGLQVDQYGNVNLNRIGEMYGPGAAALPLVAAVKRPMIFMNEHSPRTFVPKVSFITAPGYLDGGEQWDKARTEGKITGGGPALVVSSLAVLDFAPDSHRMRLVSIHPGVTLEQVRENTGFELIVPENVPETVAPTPAEMNILRQIDEGRVLRF
jgi:glutaconate CoA-transferase, subunit B